MVALNATALLGGLLAGPAAGALLHPLSANTPHSTPASHIRPHPPSTRPSTNPIAPPYAFPHPPPAPPTGMTSTTLTTLMTAATAARASGSLCPTWSPSPRSWARCGCCYSITVSHAVCVCVPGGRGYFGRWWHVQAAISHQAGCSVCCHLHTTWTPRPKGYSLYGTLSCAEAAVHYPQPSRSCKRAALNPERAGDVWPGVAGVFQVACILASGLVFFVSRTPTDGDSYTSF